MLRFNTSYAQDSRENKQKNKKKKSDLTNTFCKLVRLTSHYGGVSLSKLTVLIGWLITNVYRTLLKKQGNGFCAFLTRAVTSFVNCS